MSQQAGGGGPEQPEEGVGPPPLEHLPPWEFPEDEELEDEEGDDFLDEDDEMDMDEAWEEDEVPELENDLTDEEVDEWLSDEEEDYLSPKQRAFLECGVLEHDANFFVTASPTHHNQVPSSTCHHQTADAITFLPRPGTAVVAAGAEETAGAAAGIASSSVFTEEVLVSHRTALSIYQLVQGQPSRLLARTATCLTHYSIAASPCGNFVAASGAQGLVLLLRVQRDLQQHQQQSNTAAGGGGEAATHPASSSVGSAGGPSGAAALPWKFVHEATLLCKNGRETMVNSVRFGQFGGVPRLLVAHQDGLLYLFNLPNGTAADRSAMAAPKPSSASGSAATAAGGAAAASGSLMVRDLPDWEPLGSQINRRYVEQMMATVNRHTRYPGSGRRQQQQQQHASVDHHEQQMGGQCSQQQQQTSSVAAGPSSPAKGQKRQQQQQQSAQESAVKLRRIEPERIVQDDRDASVEAELSNVSEGLTGLGLDGPGPLMQETQGQTQSATPWHIEDPIKKGEHLLGFLVENLPTYTTAQELRRAFYLPNEHGSSIMYRQSPPIHAFGVGCSWAEKCKYIGQLLQDEDCLKAIHKLQQLRFLFADDSVPILWMTTVKEYTSTVNALKLVAQGQEALLGLRGRQRQQQQWQQQQADGDVDLGAAVCRGAYVLLLLRLLAPGGLAAMKQNARVLVLRYGPEVDPAARVSNTDARSAPRLQTCAISNIAADTAAQQRAAAATREAERLQAAAQQPGASAQAVAAAAVAAHDAAVAAAEQQMLPLNICESSPDGSWLAVGVDQAALVLVPAGPGYQHHFSHALDLCPILAPRTNHWQQTGTLGCQYLAFNSSSTLLAATSDHLRLVSVFEVATGQLLAAFSLHNRPVLPVRFMSNFIRREFGKKGREQGRGDAAGPGQQQQEEEEAAVVHEMWGDRVLVYCESRGGLHIADMSTFIHPSEQAKQLLQATGTVNARELAYFLSVLDAGASVQAGRISPKFCLKTYVEVPPEPTVDQAAAEPAAGPEPQVQHQFEAEAWLDAVNAAADGDGDGDGDGADGDGGDDGGGGDGGGAVRDAAQKINGLVVTPAGRVLVACSRELLEWQLLSGWSSEHHSRFPPAFKQAVRQLLMAAHSRSGSGSSSNTAALYREVPQIAAAPAVEGATSLDGRLLLSQLPSVVLERIIADAALPQGKWAEVRLPTPRQLQAALDARPKLPEGDMAGGFGWPWNVPVPGLIAAGAGGVAGGGVQMLQPLPLAAADAAHGQVVVNGPIPAGMPPGAWQMMMMQAMAAQGMPPGAAVVGAQPDAQGQPPPPQG